MANGVDPSRQASKLNLGCGFDLRDGYLNIDAQAFHHPDLVADVRRLTMLPSDTYDEILASDILEHLPRGDTLPALLEWSRLLRPGGLLRIRTTDLVGLLGLFHAEDRQSINAQELLVQSLYGTQGHEGDSHQTGFTETLLRHYLEQAGFEEIQIQRLDDWLLDVRAIKVTTPRCPHALTLSAYQVEWGRATVPRVMRRGGQYAVSVTLTHTGKEPWPPDQIFLSYHWLNTRTHRLAVWDGLRTPLPRTVAPGETVIVPSVQVLAPSDPGRYQLDVTLVHEGVRWFDTIGVPTLQANVKVLTPRWFWLVAFFT